MAKSANKYKNSVSDIYVFQNKILSWYDQHARSLPWRAEKGAPPAVAYHVWLSEIMLQQTTVSAVKPYFEKFLRLWPTVHDLANATQDELMHAWAGLGYYSRARNLHKAAQVIAFDHDGVFPDNEKALRALPGVGDYTSAAITSIAFQKEATVIDGNIQRIFARVMAYEGIFPKDAKYFKELVAPYFSGTGVRAGDFAQALMDLGSGICTPRSPDCVQCPIVEQCRAHAVQDVASYPKKAAKKKVPKKQGFVYIVTDAQGRLLVERRPETGILAQTLGFPTSHWQEGTTPAHSDLMYDIQETAHSITHVFTHFHLTLTLCKASVQTPNNYLWLDVDAPEMQGLPTLFNKVYNEISKTV